MHAFFKLRGLNFHQFRQHGHMELSMPAFALLKQAQMSEESGEQGSSWLAGLRHHLCISKAAVSQMLGGLEKRGFVTREADPENRRTIIVKLTDEGRTTSEAVERRFDGYVDMMIERIGEKDTREMIRLIYRLADIFQEIHE
jgi:DNA-binding MarR family transcriptional regulator